MTEWVKDRRCRFSFYILSFSIPVRVGASSDIRTCNKTPVAESRVNHEEETEKIESTTETLVHSNMELGAEETETAVLNKQQPVNSNMEQLETAETETAVRNEDHTGSVTITMPSEKKAQKEEEEKAARFVTVATGILQTAASLVVAYLVGLTANPTTTITKNHTLFFRSNILYCQNSPTSDRLFNSGASGVYFLLGHQLS
ncbi:hypothetical protein ACLOJK_017586 [Asimina triloba]